MLFLTVIYVLFKWVDPARNNMHSEEKTDCVKAISALAQTMLIIQLILTFTVNIPYVSEKVNRSFKGIWIVDIMGLSCVNSDPYEWDKVNLHVLTICFIIQFASLFRAASRCS